MLIRKDEYNEFPKWITYAIAFVLSILINVVEPRLLKNIFPIEIIAKLIIMQTSIIFILVAAVVRINRHVYLIAAVTYEDTKRMTWKERDRMAKAFHKAITIPMLFILIYSIASVIYSFPLKTYVSIVLAAMCIMGFTGYILMIRFHDLYKGEK